MYIVVDQAQEIEIVFGDKSKGAHQNATTSSYTLAADKESEANTPNIMQKKMSPSPSSGSDSFHTPRTSLETPRSSNMSENTGDLDHDTGVKQNNCKMNGASSRNDESKVEESKAQQYEEQSPNDEISRRLVEYFVVVSSVPKVKKNKEGEKSPKHEESLHSSQKAARMDVRRAHLDRDFSGGSANAAGGSCATVDTATITAADKNDEQSVKTNGSRPPRHPIQSANPPDSPGSILSIFGEPSPAEMKSVSNLQETDKMLGDQCLVIGESVMRESLFDEKRSVTSSATQNTTPSFKSSFLREKKALFKSMGEQKKKFQANTAKLQADMEKSNKTGMHNLEKTLENLNLDKTLSKFKSMKLLTPMNSSVKEERVFQKEEEKADDQSSSSDSSFSLDGVSPNNDFPPTFDNLDGSPFRPSTSARKTPVPLSPTPPPPTISVSSDRPVTPRISPLPDRHTTPRGPSENIRIGHESDVSSRGHNDDIGDCILDPVITAQYPPVDHPDQPLTPMITQFCFPEGSIQPLHEYKMPKVHHFVLTDANGGKLYGVCLTVYEEFSTQTDLEITSGEENDDFDHSREDGQERGYVECSVNSSPKTGRTRHRAKDHKYYAPRVLCLLSTWPYLSAFRTYLTQLYRLATTTNLMIAPLERYILNICSEVPAPPPGSFEVKLSILGSDIRFWAPPADQPIPYVSLPYGVIFECLDIGNVLFAWYTLACERKLLLVSSQLSLLSVCAEILCSMLFPMRWSHLYIPLLPRLLTPMLDAPMPYLCGISRENFPHAVGDISDETVVVDLDRNVITMGRQVIFLHGVSLLLNKLVAFLSILLAGVWHLQITFRHTPDLPLLPHRRKMKLEAALEKSSGDVFWNARGLTTSQVEHARLSDDENTLARMLGTADAVWDERLAPMDEAFNLAHAPDSMSLLFSDNVTASDGQSRWDAVQEGFLRFYASMLKDYLKYMPSMPTDQQSSWRGSDYGGRFLAEEFVQSQLPDFQPFLEELVGTQMFDDFVTRRMYNAGDAPCIKFFDQSIDAKRNRSKLRLKKKETPFLHSAIAHRDLKEVEAIQPNMANLPSRSRFDTRYDMKKGLYTYPTWPETFDESLYGKPRPIPKIITAEFDRRSALTAMLQSTKVAPKPGSDNPSPEATAFVLFFVTFSTTIGKEYTMLEEKHAIMGVNMLDQCPDGASMDSSVSEGIWTPKVNPPWMGGKNFQSLHSTFRPSPKKPDPPEDFVHDDVSEPRQYCNPDCTNFCTDVGKAIDIDPSIFIGNPWARTPVESEGQNMECLKSSSEEELENVFETARAIATAQIDLGFNTLRMMRMRKLPTESITYKTLIEACGRCGIAHRAQQLMEIMTQDGMALDSEVYFAFIKAFSNAESETMPPYSRATDTSSEFSANKSNPSVTSSSFSFLHSSQGETEQSIRPSSRSMRGNSTKFIDGFQNAMSSTIAANRRAFKTAKMKRTKRLSKQSLTKPKNLCVTGAIKSHLELGYCILEDLYPGIKIDTDSDTCPKCSRVLGQDDIILGWKPCQVKDFTTMCPSCKHRFVPKFSVSCNLESFEGSQGMGTPLYCDYLSPWVLLREIRNLITTSVGGKAAKVLGFESNDIEHAGIDAIIDPNFRKGNGINATLWWNMIVTFARFKIPYTFLLQGSYENQQLIMPSMTDTM